MIDQPQSAVAALLRHHGQTYCEEIGIDIARGTPSVLFRWLCASLLLSARIRAAHAVAAARALADHGWTTVERMRASTWEDRARTLNEAGYARYDEKTAAMLGQLADDLHARYGGDLRALRAQADGDPSALRRSLKQFKGIGDVGADIFCREAQSVWTELYPFVDARAAAVAGELGLPTAPRALADLVAPAELPRLMSALVRAKLSKALDRIRDS